MNTAPKLHELLLLELGYTKRFGYCWFWPNGEAWTGLTYETLKAAIKARDNEIEKLATLAPLSGEGVERACQCAQCRRNRALSRAGSPFVMDPLPEHDASKSNREQGLYRKYDVRRTDGSDATGGKHHGCEYFVLDTRHDKLAMVALTAYAIAAQAEYPDLARDLAERYGLNITAPQAAPVDGDWIKWNGGNCPVSADTSVEYRLRNGSEYTGWKAGDLDWLHNTDALHPDAEIIAYRLATPPPASQERGHECSYPNGDGPCPDCHDLALPELIRKRVEEATTEHCQGADLWLSSKMAADEIMGMLDLLPLASPPSSAAAEKIYGAARSSASSNPAIPTCQVCLRSLPECGEPLCPGRFARKTAHLRDAAEQAKPMSSEDDPNLAYFDVCSPHAEQAQAEDGWPENLPAWRK